MSNVKVTESELQAEALNQPKQTIDTPIREPLSSIVHTQERQGSDPSTLSSMKKSKNKEGKKFLKVGNNIADKIAAFEAGANGQVSMKEKENV